MSFSSDYLVEFDREMAATRTLLGRVPFDKADWRPHPKSTTLGALATHVATLPWFGTVALTTTTLDASTFTAPEEMQSVDELLAHFDETVAKTRETIAAASDEDLAVVWTMTMGGRNILEMPRSAILRGMFLNHHIHHRGQLTVYLRMNDVPLPGMYGPTADEPFGS